MKVFNLYFIGLIKGFLFLVPVLVIMCCQPVCAQQIDCRLHTVVADETIIAIAGGDEKLALLIQLLNHIDNPYELNTNSKLIIPDVSLYSEIEGIAPDELEEKIEELRGRVPENILKESDDSFADKIAKNDAADEELVKPVPAPLSMFVGAIPAIMPMFGLYNGSVAEDANTVLNEIQNSYLAAGIPPSMPQAKRYPAIASGGVTSSSKPSSPSATAKKIAGREKASAVKKGNTKTSISSFLTGNTSDKKVSGSSLANGGSRTSGSALAGARATGSSVAKTSGSTSSAKNVFGGASASVGAGVGSGLGAEIGNLFGVTASGGVGTPIQQTSGSSSNGILEKAGSVLGGATGAAMGTMTGGILGAGVGAAIGSKIGEAAGKAVSGLLDLL